MGKTLYRFLSHLNLCLFLQFGAAQQNVQGCAKARHEPRNKVLLSLAAKYAERVEADVSKTKSRDRGNFRLEQILVNFHVPPCLKIGDSGAIQHSNTIEFGLEEEGFSFVCATRGY